MMMKRFLLLVDDDQIVRPTFKQLESKHNFELICTKNNADAIEIINLLPDSVKISVVAIACSELNSESEHLFNKIKQCCSAAVRVVLASKHQSDSLFAIIGDGDVSRVVTQPWTKEKLSHTLEKAFTEYELAQENLRLTQELEKANRELKELNVELEEKVKDKVEQLAQAVNYDALTGLPSRNLIHDQLEHVVQYAKRANQTIAVLYVGLDNFKLINESMGHATGDELLKQVTERLSIHIGSSDAIARMGGDEFCLIINNTRHKEDTSEIAKRFLDLMLVPFELNGREVFLTVSIGISLYPEDSKSAKTLFSNAESAMRKVKAESKNGFQFYSGKLSQSARKRLSLESQLHKALHRNEFELFFQPRVNIESGMIVAVEALLRWHHPKKGLLYPVDFMPVLEETGLIEPVGEWVIEQSCRTLVRWTEIGLQMITIAVNISAKQFRNSDFLSTVERILEKTGMPNIGVGLEFEITESLLMENIKNTKRMLNGLNDMGIKLAIDDFGTGYSSLSYLIQFPLHYLKIDKSFVTNIADSDDAKAIVEAIISLSFSLKLCVVAEGIETIEQLNTLQALACKEFQGFLFSEPLVEEEVVRMLKADKRLCLSPASDMEHQTKVHRLNR